MNLTEIIESMGGMWIATRWAFAVMSGSVYPTMTSERRMAGEPVYPDSDEIESVDYAPPDEWKQAGGKRITASRILHNAEHIAGQNWNAVSLALSDDKAERVRQSAIIGSRIAQTTGWPHAYCHAVCNRWGEQRFMTRYEGAVSREYRISYTHACGELIGFSGVSKKTEIKRRSEVVSIINGMFVTARDRLENA